MNTKPNPQVAPAMALVQLLREHPNLPRIVWHVDNDELRGHMFGPLVGDFNGLHAYAQVLGGSIRPQHTYPMDGRTYRVHELTARWRDVPVIVSVGIAEAAPLAVAA